MRQDNNIDLPSFSVSNVGSQDDENLTMDSEEMQRFMRENADLTEISYLQALNQTYVEIMDKFVAKVDQAIMQNRTAQSSIRSYLTNSSPAEDVFQRQKQMPHLPCLPPYFKDSSGMAPRMNDEALEISRIFPIDPLVDEPRRWYPKESDLLASSVCESLKDQQVLKLETRKELLHKKLRASGIETTEEQKEEWRNEIERINRRVVYIRGIPIVDFLAENTDYSEVDWAKISARDFQGTRSITQLRQKWCNELSPVYNQEPWSVEEDERLLDIARDVHNWDTIAQMLGTNRTSFHCFERHVYLQQNEREPKAWTPEEDFRLKELILVHKVGEEVPWGKIAMYMPGRNKLACEYRYTRSISDKLRHGRWTEAEDMLLLEAINKYGPQNWIKISECVQNRSALQCRDRWIHVLDHKRRDVPWSWEEHQRLLYGVQLFGRDQCAKIAKLIPGRNNMDVRMRIRLLVRYQIEQQREENSANKKIVFRHFANNYLSCKTRRKNAVELFGKYLEEKQNNRRMQLASRLGLGSFVAKPTSGVNLDYTKIKTERAEEFNCWKILGSGRWVKVHHKNPNEYDREDLMNELNQLPADLREEAILWLDESDKRLEIEREREKDVPEDPNEAKEYYDNMYPQEKLEELSARVAELLPPKESDILFYEQHKKRPPKIRIKREPRVKGEKKRQKKKRRKKTKLEKLIRNIDNLDENQIEGLRWNDRLMIEMFKEMDGMTPDEKRKFVIVRLCQVLRQRVHMTTAQKIKRNHTLRENVFQQMVEYVREVVDSHITPKSDKLVVDKPPQQQKQPKAQEEVAEEMAEKDAVVLPANWEKMSMKELMRLKLNPQLLTAVVQHAQTARANQAQVGGVQQEQIEEETIGERVRKRRASKGNTSLPGLDRLKSTVILPVAAVAVHQQQQMPPPKRPCIQPTVFATSDILGKLLPPCSATLSVMGLYERKVQRQLQSEVNTLSRFRKLKNEDVIGDAPGTSSDRPIGRNQPEDPISNEMRTTWEYAQLKKRMYRLFFLPLAMQKALDELVTEEKESVVGGDEEAGPSNAGQR